MQKILRYIKWYVNETDKRIFCISVLFTAILIFVNYHFGLNRAIYLLDEPGQYLSWFTIFFVSFTFAYALQKKPARTGVFRNKKFLSLLLLAPAMFAWKMSANFYFHFTQHNDLNTYLNQVVYWPFKLLILAIALLLVWKFIDEETSFYGMPFKNFDPAPYVIMLAFMIPLIALASGQPDFLRVYPKLKNMHVAGTDYAWFYKLVYELAYGSDFISIELFFRGFLILAFAKYAGKDAILPMAVFYCTIHFGKPLGECISSFFGGLLLGIITFHTSAIWGGLIVHLGIAWLMELGGYLAGLYYS